MQIGNDCPAAKEKERLSFLNRSHPIMKPNATRTLLQRHLRPNKGIPSAIKAAVGLGLVHRAMIAFVQILLADPDCFEVPQIE